MRRPYLSSCYVLAVDPATGKAVLTFRHNENARTGRLVRAMGAPLAKGLGGVPQLAFGQDIPL